MLSNCEKIQKIQKFAILFGGLYGHFRKRLGNMHMKKYHNLLNSNILHKKFDVRENITS